MDENDVIDTIHIVAERFGWSVPELEYYVTTNAKEFYTLIYMQNFITPPYLDYGKTVKERIQNLDLFLKSDDLQKMSSGISGTTLREHRLFILKAFCPELYDLAYRVKLPCVLIYARVRNEKFYSLLFHELLHILIRHNKMAFTNERQKEGFLKAIELKMGTYQKRGSIYERFYEQEKDEHTERLLLKL